MTLTLDPETVERESVTGLLRRRRLAPGPAGPAAHRLPGRAADPKVVGKWRKGNPPQPAAEFRLRTAYSAARMLVDAYGANTARAWFLGSNSRLDDEAPAWLLRHAGRPRRRALSWCAAARAFAGSAGLTSAAVWRLGHRGAPLEYVPRHLCGWRHRWDDPERKYRTLYCAESSAHLPARGAGRPSPERQGDRRAEGAVRRRLAGAARGRRGRRRVAGRAPALPGARR